MALWPSKKVSSALGALKDYGMYGPSKIPTAEPYEDFLRRSAVRSNQASMYPGMMNVTVDMAERKDPLHTGTGRLAMLASRLRVVEGGKWGLEFIETALSEEKVFIFVVQNGSAVILEDEPGMFPSDTLVTQLRLLQK